MDLVLEILRADKWSSRGVVLHVGTNGFQEMGKILGLFKFFARAPSTLVYESLVWLPLGATMLKVALEADYDEKECDDINAWLHVILSSFLRNYRFRCGLIKCSPRDTLICRELHGFGLVGLLFELSGSLQVGLRILFSITEIIATL